MSEPLDLAEQPGEWTRCRLKDVTTWVNRGVAPTYADADTGALALSQKCVRPDLSVSPELGRPIETENVPRNAPARLRVGDVVVNSTGRGTLGRAALIRALPPETLVADGHVTVVRVKEARVSPRFLTYLLGTQAFDEQANACLAIGSTNQTELGREALRRIRLAMPPGEEQQRIADYLDAETAIIQRLFAEQAAQLNLQEERFRSSIVLSLIPDEPPSDWSRCRLKYLFDYERNGIWGEEPQGDGDDILCVRVADFDRLSFTAGPGANTVRSVPARQQASRLLRKGDVLLEKSGGSHEKPVGCAVTFELDERAVCSNFVAALRPSEGFHPRWAGLRLAAGYQARLNEPYVKQTTGIQNLDSRAYLGTSVWVPPFAEQRHLAEMLDEQRHLVTKTIDEIYSQGRLLQERRQALITHAVTRGIEGLPGVA